MIVITRKSAVFHTSENLFWRPLFDSPLTNGLDPPLHVIGQMGRHKFKNVQTFWPH